MKKKNHNQKLLKICKILISRSFMRNYKITKTRLEAIQIIHNSFLIIYYISRSYTKQNCTSKNYTMNILLPKAIYKFVYFCYNKLCKTKCIPKNYTKKKKKIHRQKLCKSYFPCSS